MDKTSGKILYFIMIITALIKAFGFAKSPEKNLIEALRGIEISPVAGFPQIDQQTEIPCSAASRQIYSFTNDYCPIRSKFKTAFVEIYTGSAVISLSEMTGCIASKTTTSFDEMAQTPWLARKTAANRGNVEIMAKQVFEGSYDCVAYKDKNARVWRQEWDGRMWFANDGGSHRAGAVWQIDRENGTDRKINCDITEKKIAPEFENFCAAHSIFMFQANANEELVDCMANCREAGIILGLQNRMYAKGDIQGWCLIVPRNNLFHEKIREAVNPAFDFADWVLNPSGPLQPACEIVNSHNLALA